MTKERFHSNTIVFIHGMFMNPASWGQWLRFFEATGYACHAPSYPFHEGDPSSLRRNIDPQLGRLTFGEVVETMGTFIDSLPESPILVRHSKGGLVVQKLIQGGRGEAGVCVDSAPPRGVTSLQWSYLRANLPTINPPKGNSPCLPGVDWFHYAFCNTMPLEETRVTYENVVVPESRNIPRSSSRSGAAIDFRAPHNPLLFIAGEADHIIPASLNHKNFRAYTDSGSEIDFKVFAGRTHYICAQAGWEDVAEFVAAWLA